MKRAIIIVLTIAAALATAYAAKPARASRDVRKEQQENSRKLDEARRRINSVNLRTRAQLDYLNVLQSDITRADREISAIQASIDSLSSRINQVSDSITALENHVKKLSDDYAASLRTMRDRRRSLGTFAFIFSSSSFHEAWRRINYLTEFNRWCHIKNMRLKESRQLLELRRTALAEMKKKQHDNMNRMAAARTVMDRRRAESEATVASLRKEGDALNAELTKRRQNARKLSAELDRIIAEEARRAENERRAAEAKRLADAGKKKAETTPAQTAQTKPEAKPAQSTPKTKPEKPQAPAQAPAQQQARPAADRQLTGSFRDNKGRLLFPVAGSHRIIGTFGKTRHASLSNIEIDNPGIDIETAAGEDAHAVFDGTVSSVFYLDGYSNVVIVRHGEYLTVYGGIDRLKVKKGDKVAHGQSLGHIAPMIDDPAKAVLHFEVRREKEKLNPLDWLR